MGTRGGAHGTWGLRLRWYVLGGPRAVAADLTHTAFPWVRWLRARYGAGPLPLLWIRYAIHGAGWLAGAARAPTSPNQDLR